MANEIDKLNLQLASKFLQAYLECSDGIQDAVRKMLLIVNDPQTDVDDRDMALHTLADALFPNLHEGKLGLDLEESERMGSLYSDETAATLTRFDQQEATFAERLRSVMSDMGFSQDQLAQVVGVGQSAISNMLVRNCRPQRKTVERFAKALNVSPEHLWPTIAEVE